MSDLNYAVDDTGPSVTGTLTNLDGTPFVLTNCTVRFQMRGVRDGRYKVDAPAVVTGAATGLVRYDWAVGDLDTPGDFESRWRIYSTTGGTIEHSDPVNTISVAL